VRDRSFLQHRAIRDWIVAPGSMHERMALACASVRTRGARLGALSRPGLLRRVRTRSMRSPATRRRFALATTSRAAVAPPCREVLARQRISASRVRAARRRSYAYWLHRQNRLSTVSTPDALYWFSPRHEERAVARRYVPITEYPIGVAGSLRYDRTAFPEALDTSRWVPPPYRDVYRDERFRFDKPTCVICNKATDEQFRWHRRMTNHLPTDLVLELSACCAPAAGRLLARARTS
jgi:hypothetical protein